jgi:uncharacterized protein (DUF433 family)
MTVDPAVMGAMRCIRGMRITVSLLLGLLSGGMSEAEIAGEHPWLVAEDFRQAPGDAAALAAQGEAGLAVAG